MPKYQPRHAAPKQPSRGMTRLAMGASLGAAVVAPTFASTASAASSSSTVAKASSVSVQELLSKIKFCESSNNYQAVNPSGASGAYQFMPSTWRGLAASKGYPNVLTAPAAVQDAGALELYQEAGTSPWVSSQPCWSKLVSAPTSVSTVSVVKAATTTTGHVGSAAIATTPTTSAAAGLAEAKIAATTPAATVKSGVVHAGLSYGGVTAPATTVSGTAQFSPLLSAGWAKNPFTGLTLNATEKATIAAATKVQQSSPEWTAQAQAGQTVHRTVVTSGDFTPIPVVTHSAANWYSKGVSTIASGTDLAGHYVNIDWFLITRGAHAGEYINTGILHRSDLPLPKNGLLPQSQLATIPDYLRHYPASADAKYLNPQGLKQLVWMNAAFHRQFGVDFKLNESYRTYQHQMDLYKQLGPAIAAKPGTSEHEQGLAIDINSVTVGGSAGSKWMNVYSSAFGWQRPGVFDRTTTEYWHYNYVG